MLTERAGYRRSNEFRNMPIPPLPSVDGWKEVEIEECGEPLVLLSEFPLLVLSPQYFLQGIKGSQEKCFARLGVAQRLAEASNLLPKGYRLVIWDAWRPIEVQQALFDKFRDLLSTEYPDTPEDQIILMTQTYVSLPSLNPKRPSPHNTGGAIDLIVQNRNCILLPMGTPFDEFRSIAGTRYFEENPDLENAEIFKRNRRLLYWAMTKAGFTNYPEEWWHFDFGNQFWAKQKGVRAIYGTIKP